MLRLSDATVRRLFEGQPGVLGISMPRLLPNRKHKPHTLLRIPESAIARFKQQWAAGFGLEVKPGRRRV